MSLSVPDKYRIMRSLYRIQVSRNLIRKTLGFYKIKSKMDSKTKNLLIVKT